MTRVWSAAQIWGELDETQTPFAAISVTVLLVWSMTATTVSMAEPPSGGERSAEELMQAQLPLLDATDAIQAYLDDHPDIAKAGYSGLSMSPEHGTVTLFWVGALDPGVGQLLDDLRAKLGIQIDVVPAPYTDGELRAAAEDVIDADPGVFSVDVDPAGVGLLVTVEDEAARARFEARRSANAMILQVVVGEAAVGAAVRQNDASPWTGGARVRGLGCSTGFGMILSGTYYMLTAAHCFPSGNGVTVLDGAGHTMGTTRHTNYNLDGQLIDVNSNAVSGYMYDGAWNNSSGAREKVVGTSKPVNGTLICTSGSYTGTNCDIAVTNDRHHYYLTSRPGVYIWGVAAVRRVAGYRAVGKGDSGGPVLTNTSTSRQIRAAGVISALHSTGVSCSGTASGQCSRGVVYVPIQNALRGGGIKTG